MRILITDTMYCTEAGRQAAEKIADCLGDVVLNPLSRKLTSGEIRELRRSAFGSRTEKPKADRPKRRKL